MFGILNFCAIQAHYQEELPMENPKLPPILVNKAGSVYYVYTYKNVWDRELKRSKRGESKR